VVGRVRMPPLVTGSPKKTHWSKCKCAWEGISESEKTEGVMEWGYNFSEDLHFWESFDVDHWWSSPFSPDTWSVARGKPANNASRDILGVAKFFCKSEIDWSLWQEPTSIGALILFPTGLAGTSPSGWAKISWSEPPEWPGGSGTATEKDSTGECNIDWTCCLADETVAPKCSHD
jgi:hypothetical protein